jgi:hypothetical protein
VKLIGAVLSLLLLVSCGKSNVIVGKWRLTSPAVTGGTVEMMFNNDGSVSRVFRPDSPTQMGYEMSGTYRYTDDGLHITIPFGPGRPPTKVRGKVEDGVLTIESPGGIEVLQK